MSEPRKIPYGKPAQLGNYKIWRGKYPVGKGRGKDYIDQINVSNLDGTWQVKVPATMEMCAILSELYADEGKRDILAAYLSNMAFVTITGNGYFQRAVELCAIAYANPSLLTKKDKQHKQFIKNVEALTKAFLEWRKVYDERVKQDEPTERDDNQEETARQMLDEIDKE
mgnify:FL=1